MYPFETGFGMAPDGQSKEAARIRADAVDFVLPRPDHAAETHGQRLACNALTSSFRIPLPSTGSIGNPNASARQTQDRPPEPPLSRGSRPHTWQKKDGSKTRQINPSPRHLINIIATRGQTNLCRVQQIGCEARQGGAFGGSM